MKKTLTGLDFKIQEMAGRIRELREISGFSAQTMALKTGTSEEEYLRCEAGQSDLNFAFLYRCALAFGVDVTDLIEGSSPKLRSYTLTRAGNGQKIEQAHEMIYYNMASGFQNRIADPLFVENKYSDEAFYSDIELTSHVGQECDLVIRGSMKVQVGGHTELLHEGDCIYYDSSIPHGMVAADGQDCLFYAIVLRPQEPSLPEVTAKTWHDGFYHTGDLAWRDEDGFYWYVGRADDVIKSSGYRIGPFEIENVIMELPYVLECGVSAAPDEIRGQVVKASIVLVKGTEGTGALKKEIQTYVKTHTAPYKYPRIVEFREALPKTTSGKIIRSKL